MTVSDLQGAGVDFEAYDFPGLKTERGIAQTGDVRAAWFKDSEGNLIGIVQLPAGVDPAQPIGRNVMEGPRSAQPLHICLMVLRQQFTVEYFRTSLNR